MEPKSSSRLRKLFWVLFAIGVLLLLVVCAISAGLNYLKSPVFVQKMEERFSLAIQGEVDLVEPTVTWQKVEFQHANLSSENGWRAQLETGQFHWNIPQAFKSGQWTPKEVKLEQAKIWVGKPKTPAELPPRSAMEVKEVQPPATKSSFWEKWMPSSVVADEIQIEKFEAQSVNQESPWHVGPVGLRLIPLQGWESWRFEATSSQPSVWQIPGVPWPYRVSEAKGTFNRDNFHVHQVMGRVGQDGMLKLQGTGHWDQPQDHKWQAELQGLKTSELPSQWHGLAVCFEGLVEAEIQISSSKTLGEIRLKQASSKMPPGIQFLGTLLRSDRLQRIHWDVAQAKFEHRENLTKIRDLKLEAKGLLAVEGEIQLDHRNASQAPSLSGELWLGMSKSIFSWVPSLEKHIFNQSRNVTSGYVWTKVRLSGTTAEPKEDLSPKLLALSQDGLELSEKAAKEALELMKVLDRTLETSRSPESEAPKDSKTETLPKQLLDQGLKMMDRVLPALPFGK